MSRFDAGTQPLRGTWLVDASAGTGKTHAITSLVLRLLLGHDGRRTGVSPFGIEQLLIVTFTNAATNELRGRIRTRVRAALARFSGEGIPGSDELIDRLLADSADPVADRERLALAAMSLDLAAIHTIHAFAKRMLQGNAFESGAPFDAALHEDAATEQRELLRDLWRKRVYPLDPLCAGLLSREITLAAFVALVGKLATRTGLQFEGGLPPDWEALQASVRSAGSAFLQAWRSEEASLREALDALQWKKGVGTRSAEAFAALSRCEELPDFPAVEHLARAELAEALDGRRKNQSLPPSRVLDLAEELLAFAPLLRNRLIRDACGEFAARNAARRHGSGRLGYDDLLILLDEGLDAPSGNALAEAIRSRYPVALVDECQDTDPLQWKVFTRIYPEGALFFVGDPKQSIYGFRGADVHAYLAASRTAQGRLTLDVNRRSTPRLIDAVNGLFGLRADRNPFRADDIGWRDAEKPAAADAPLLRRAGVDAAPLQIIRLPPVESGGKEEMHRRLAAACADHLAGLLQDAAAGRLLLGERPVEPADIACLVRWARDAELLAHELAARGVPSVFVNRDSVYRSPVAPDLHRLLMAVLEPRSQSRLRSALGCALVGRGAMELEDCLGDETRMLVWQERFTGWREQLARRGVQGILREVLLALQVPERLLATPRGERDMADCLHLLELLAAERTALDSDDALAARFAALMAHPEPDREEQQLRLDSEAKRVTVSTIHGSKGLQYPIVCLPFPYWTAEAKEPLYRDSRTGRPLFDLSARPEALESARLEQLAEDLRLLYVGCTRAKSLLVLGVSGPPKGRRKSPPTLEGSALGWLLDGEGLAADEALDRLWAIPGAERVEPAPCVWRPAPRAVDEASAARFAGRIPRDWRETSYSGLVRAGTERAEGVLRKPEESHSARTLQARAARDATPTRGTFPAGPRWGSLLHELMEQVDFSRPAGDEPNASLIAGHCRRQPDLTRWQTVITEFVEALRVCPIGGPGGFRLADVPEDARVAEMRFEMPVERIDTAALETLMRTHEPLARDTAVLAPRALRGILKGSIDLVVCHAGRYYLIDYKSTWLGDASRHYTQARIAEDIRSHRYELQYTLYTVALVRLLRARLGPAFDYATHVGGVVYLYLRALGPEPADDGEPAGVFLRRPAVALIEGIEAMLGGPSR